MTNWEYRVVSITSVDSDPEAAAASVAMLNAEGLQGWEAVGITATSAASSKVLLKRPLAAGRTGGGRM